jgi:uncharacterized ferritin-like protein (DUF455 family)
VETVTGSAPADIEAWAEHYVLTRELSVKLAPPPLPRSFRANFEPVRLPAPGRPPELRPAERGERTPKPEALVDPHHRARALHSFFHHELQAAELMCWAVLAFADAEPEFKKGLLGICLDEIRHMNLYRERIEALGASIGSFGVRDWFWKRVPSCPDKLAFVSVMGMGLEAANLEYAPSFASRFRAAGDEASARMQERVAHEELAHVSFATRWFTRWTGGCSFQVWAASLPPPLSPWVLRGEPIAEAARRRAGMSSEFVAALAAYVPEPKGRAVPVPQRAKVPASGRVRFAWVFNLDAEFELARPNYTPRARVLNQLARYGTASRDLLGPDDVSLDGPQQPSGLEGAIGRAWCPTPRALALLRAAGVEPEPHPAAEVLRRVNHRRFAFELGGALPRQRYVESRRELETCLTDGSGPWLLKRPLVFAGRGQQRVYRYAAITSKEWSWIEASLAQDGLIVEPLVRPLLELSLHGFVWRDGRLELGRICVQQVSDRGVYRGVRLADRGDVSEAEALALQRRAASTARSLALAGYFGPFGIDAYRYADAAGVAFCEQSEINARFSMGFSTGFARPAHTLRVD